MVCPLTRSQGRRRRTWFAAVAGEGQVDVAILEGKAPAPLGTVRFALVAGVVGGSHELKGEIAA